MFVLLPILWAFFCLSHLLAPESFVFATPWRLRLFLLLIRSTEDGNSLLSYNPHKVCYVSVQFQPAFPVLFPRLPQLLFFPHQRQTTIPTYNALRTQFPTSTSISTPKPHLALIFNSYGCFGRCRGREWGRNALTKCSSLYPPFPPLLIRTFQVALSPCAEETGRMRTDGLRWRSLRVGWVVPCICIYCYFCSHSADSVHSIAHGHIFRTLWNMPHLLLLMSLHVYKANIHISYVRVKDYFNFLITLGDRVERKLVQEVSVLDTVQFSYCYDGSFSFFYNFS